MKILHCCLSNFYIDGYAYQENMLPRFNAKDGHEVLIIASTETYKDGKLAYVEPCAYETEYGVKIVRIPYAAYLPGMIGRKLRVYPQFKKLLYDFAPDVILFHGACGEAITVASKYRAAHPKVKLYVDSHEAFYNSARNWLSKNILHAMFYRYWYKKALPNIEKVLYIGLGEKEYMKDFLKTPEDKLEYYPLGGKIMLQAEKQQNRSEIRREFNLDERTLVFVHSGKMDKLKRTIQLMQAFSECEDIKATLLIVGTVLDEIKSDFDRCLAGDTRIKFLGWMKPEELARLISAADLYLQPGSPSATMQMALCCGTPVLIKNESFYQAFIDRGCAYPIDTDADIVELFQRVTTEASDLDQMSSNAYRAANELLDYSKLAQRLYR